MNTTHDDTEEERYPILEYLFDMEVVAVNLWLQAQGAEWRIADADNAALFEMRLHDITYFLGRSVDPGPQVGDIAAQLGVGLPYDNDMLRAMLQPVLTNHAVDGTDFLIEYPDEECDALWAVARPRPEHMEEAALDRFMRRFVTAVEELSGALR